MIFLFFFFSYCQSFTNTLEIKKELKQIICNSAQALFSSEWQGNGGAVMCGFCSLVTLMNSLVTSDCEAGRLSLYAAFPVT